MMPLGKPSKLKTGKTWENFPKGGGGGKKKSKKFPSFTWEIFQNRGGGPEFSQSSQVHKKGGQKGLKTLIRQSSQVWKRGGGGQDSSHCSQVHKVPNLHRGGGQRRLGIFPKFSRFRVLKASLKYIWSNI